MRLWGIGELDTILGKCESPMLGTPSNLKALDSIRLHKKLHVLIITWTIHLITSPTIINQVGGRFELHISVWGLLFRVEPSIMWYFLVIFTLVLLFIFKINFIGITSRYTCCLLLVSTGRPSKEHVCPGIGVLHRLPQYFLDNYNTFTYFNHKPLKTSFP